MHKLYEGKKGGGVHRFPKNELSKYAKHAVIFWSMIKIFS